MGISPDALYSAILSDVSEFLPLGPVDPSKLPPDVSYKQFACTSLVYDITRKWVPSDTSEADAAGWSKFSASNKKCRDWHLSFRDFGDEQLFGEFLREVDAFLHPEGELLFSSMFDLLKYGRTGPGSALGARGHSMYAKLFSSKLTVTSEDLYLTYKDYIQWFPGFEEAEVHRYQTYGAYDIVTGSRCSFVPKTSSSSRMICVEPSVNMIYQLGLGTILEDRLSSYFNIALTTQPYKNRRLAYLGSKNGSFSTIDLSSASDSISMRLCEEIFPSWFFKTLMELRSPSLSYGSTRVPLYMISTMGNGFTFPLQTVIFSCMIRAAYKTAGVSLLDGPLQNWACFGDDLICETKVFPYLLRLLSLCGFEVNSSKTFSEGRFRESCGTDWFNGQPVRSIFVKRLRSQQDIFVTINNLNSWSAYTGICLNKTVRFLIERLKPSNRMVYVPFDENNDAGIRVPSILLPHKWRRDANKSYLYKVFRSSPKFIRFGDGVIHYPRGVKKLSYNPSGLYLSFLYGELVSCKVSVRHDRVLYREKLRCTPNWDYIPPDSFTNGYKLSWQQWETAVMANTINPVEIQAEL